ncbi:MAG: PIN domain-containing protein [Acidobacteriota bacterium]
MIEWIKNLISRYVEKGILIDTNVLLLYFIGRCDPNQISKFKRTRQFVIEDYELLIDLLHSFKKIITTPNILTEVSNLSGQLGEPFKTEFFTHFVSEISTLEEHYVASQEAIKIEEFVKVGLTDSCIFDLSKDKYLVLTDDFKLSQYLQKKSIDVINFNHIRPLGWT